MAIFNSYISHCQRVDCGKSISNAKVCADLYDFVVHPAHSVVLPVTWRMWSRCCRITTLNAVGGVQLQRDGVGSLSCKSGDTPMKKKHGKFPWKRLLLRRLLKSVHPQLIRASKNTCHPFAFSDHKGYSSVLPVESASLVLNPARMMRRDASINGIRTIKNLEGSLGVPVYITLWLCQTSHGKWPLT